MKLEGFIHQSALISAIERYPEISFTFLIGGYGCGKSFSGVLIILYIYNLFNGSYARVGIGGTSQTLLRKTLLSDLFKVLNESGIKYYHNKQEHTIMLGTVEFIYISISDPDDIYAYNFCVFICDELDELPQERAVESFKAIQERTRIVGPNGRVPFSIFMTTAQGLKGTYRIIESLKEDKIPHIVIRGLTKNNTTLSPEYVNRLYSIYSPLEAEAFLEGKFVNLYTGRVYPDYNESLHRYMPFEIKEDDVIYVGQDLNSGFSKAIVYVVRGKNIFCVAEFSFNSVGDAPRILRSTYPSQRILWLPDASAKEIMLGYREEIAQSNIELISRTLNPSVTERILVVNKLFRLGFLFVFGTVKNYNMALKTRQFDKDGNPAKGKGPLAHDHYCDAAEYALWYIVFHQTFLKDFVETLRLKAA
jgi:hypothetical protein